MNIYQHQIPMSSKVTIFRNLALFSHVLLIVWMATWYFLLVGTADYSPLFIFVVYLLPLLLPLSGVIRAKPYTHAWACFIVLWYFLHSLTIMYAEPKYMIHASIELVLASVMFVGCSMFARHRGQELGISLPKLSKVMEDEKALFEAKGKDD